MHLQISASCIGLSRPVSRVKAFGPWAPHTEEVGMRKKKKKKKKKKISASSQNNIMPNVEAEYLAIRSF